MKDKPIGKRHPEPAGSERKRDEQRDAPTPRYAGGPWEVADDTTLESDEVEPPPEGNLEGSGQHAGMGKGDHPRKSKDREK